jgi:hypothetical protein
MAGANHSIDASPEAEKPWVSEARPEVTDEVFELRAASVTGVGPKPGAAHVYFYKSTQGNACSLRRVGPSTGKRGPFQKICNRGTRPT